MRARGVRRAAVLTTVAAAALALAEVAWAPWQTGNGHEAVAERATCVDGQKFDLVWDGNGREDPSAVPPPVDPALPPTHKLPMSIAVNWPIEKADKFPPAHKLLVDDRIAIQKEQFLVRFEEGNSGDPEGWWDYYGVVTVLWGRLLENTDTVGVSFSRFSHQGPSTGYYESSVVDCRVAADNNVEGEETHDLIVADWHANVLVGNEGNDFIKGRAGDDTITGDGGHDELWAEDGADDVQGGDGDDRIHAAGDDDQRDVVDCGAGNDTVWVSSLEADIDPEPLNCEQIKMVPATDPSAGMGVRAEAPLAPLG